MLQKMFPKKNEKKPEIRFAGFTDDWEQRKLIDYLEVSSERIEIIVSQKMMFYRFQVNMEL